MKHPMHVDLTKKQYRDLLLSVFIGNYIREAVEESEGKNFKKVRAVEEYLLACAHDFDADDLVENFEGALIPREKITEQYHDYYIDKYEEDSFWHNLVTRLGQRDFGKYATKEERETVKKNDGWLWGVIDRYCEKYDHEFEEHGIERFVIDEEKE